MTRINNTTPTCCARSRCFSPTGRPRTASIRKKKRCPPSRTGIGSRFNTPRLMLRIATKIKKVTTPSRLLAGHLGDQERPAERLRRDIAFDHLVQRDKGDKREVSGLLKSLPDRHDRRHLRNRVLRLDPDEPDLAFVAVGVALFLFDGIDGDLDGLVVPHQRDVKGAAVAVLDAAREVGPALD